MPRFHRYLLLVVSLLALSLFLLASALKLGPGHPSAVGFPLDDSWIHQTYARNLAQRGEWSFRPGQPSAGSTSPLWSLLLSFGFHLHLSPYLWTYALGGLFLWLLASLMEESTRRLLPFYGPILPWVGLFFALEWRMVWMAASGMETLLHALLLAFAATLLLSPTPRYLTLGAAAGIAVWVRPDGLLLLPFVLAHALLRPATSLALRFSRVLKLLAGFLPIFGLYLLFNLLLEGRPWPNTFYAKQAEYLSWQLKPLWERLGLYLLQLVHGPAILLLPFAVFSSWHIFRSPDFYPLRLSASLLLFWWLTFFTVYLLRLPPYQHGRYIMPLMPLFLLLGIWGVLFAGRELFSPARRLLLMAARASLVVLTGIYLFFGARAYAQEVAYIEGEMVDVARWVQEHLPPQAVIAAHDIGALGYFDTHSLVDLAGLITPQVIPILRDETALREYLMAQEADYLIVIQGIYPHLEAGLEVVYRSPAPIATELGGDPMVVYRWR